MTSDLVPGHTYDADIPLALLHDSPTNPRTAYPEPGLLTLAASVKAIGLLQRITVRDMTDLECEKPAFEIVCGHRRTRAARLAGLETIPATVRTMTDEEVAIAQLHENSDANREDVHPLDEAAALQRLIATHGITVDTLIQQTGKSKASLYGLLKLNRLTGKALQAFRDGTIGREIAEAIARIPASLHTKALGSVTHQTSSGEGRIAIPTRQAKQYLQSSFTETLQEAEFDRELALTLPDPIGYRPACRHCDHCTDQRDHYPDLPAGRCTDAPCFIARTTHHTLARADQLRQAGKLIEPGPGTPDPSPLIRLTAYCATVPAALRPADCMVSHISLAGAAQALQAAGVAGIPEPVHLHSAYTDGQPRIVTGYTQSAAEKIHDLYEDCIANPATAAAKPTAAASAAAPGHDTDTDTDPDSNTAVGASPHTPADDAEGQALQSAAKRLASDSDDLISQAQLRAATAPRTTDDLRLIVEWILWQQSEGDIPTPDITIDLAGLTQAMRNSLTPDRRADIDEDDDATPYTTDEVHACIRAQLPTLSADALGRLIMLLVLQDGPSDGFGYPAFGNYVTPERHAARLTWLRRAGIDPAPYAVPTDDAAGSARRGADLGDDDE